VASTPTAWRVLGAVREPLLARLMVALVQARAQVWEWGLRCVGPSLRIAAGAPGGARSGPERLAVPLCSPPASMTNFCLFSTALRSGYTATAANSLSTHHPRARIWVLELTSSKDLRSDRLSSPNVVRLQLADIGIDQAQLRQLMATVSSPREYVDALKPWLLRYVLAQSRKPVTLVADDVYVFRPLGALATLAAANAAVFLARASRTPLTGPRVPLPKPLIPGAIDLDVMAVGTEGDAFLADWQAHLLAQTRIGPASAQAFIDSAADRPDRAILWDPGYNCGYWNLRGHFQLPAGGLPEVDGRPINLLHLHGFDARRPHLLTTEFDSALPVLLSDQPDLARFCRDYARAVQTQLPPQASVASILRRGRLPSGLQIDSFMKDLWRAEMRLADTGQAPPLLDPFRAGGERVFLDWLNSPPDGSGGGLSRYLRAIYEARPDLQLAFPAVDADPAPMLRWAANHGREELSIPPYLAPRLRQRSPHPLRGHRHVARPAIGANVVGFFTAELGIGEAARLLLEAFRAVGMPVRTHNITLTDSPHTRAQPARNPHLDLGPFCVNVMCMNPPELMEFRRRVEPGFFRGRYNVGVWAWETETLPLSWRPALRWLDEVWVPSQYTQNAVAQASAKPVFVIPSPMIAPRYPGYMDRAYFGLPDRFTFLFMFDFFSSVWRKNPVGLIESFRSAFEPDEGPCLVIKSMNGHLRVEEYEEVLCAAAGRPDIWVIDRYLLPEERVALLAACDSYVSLHRAEGFGLTMAEAMALGKPVIATGYSGNLNFMNETNSWLVGYQRVPVGRDWDRYPPGDIWAEPDPAEAAALLRCVWENPASARERAQRGQADVERILAPAAVGQLVRDRLEQVAPVANRREALLRIRAPRARGTARGLARRMRSWVSLRLSSRG
jgi:glycosyltransferase involved in cell wall biosynthesis